MKHSYGHHREHSPDTSPHRYNREDNREGKTNGLPGERYKMEETKTLLLEGAA